MQFSKWFAKGKSVRSKQPLKSPKIAQIFAVSLVALIAIAGLVLAAKQATPKTVTAAVQPVTTAQTQPAPKTSATKPAAHAATAAAQAPEKVTITGCLEQKDDAFRLKDTDGVDAPKSRNWKTGFLTKHSATVNLVDQRNRNRLANHVGERVSITGMLSERDLDVQRLSRVANTCE
jgi:chemotaxis protein histidine kinase CheA